MKIQFGKIFKITFGCNLITQCTFLLFKFRKNKQKKLNYTQSYTQVTNIVLTCLAVFLFFFYCVFLSLDLKRFPLLLFSLMYL